MIKNRYCRRCGHAIRRETAKGLRKEYPYYCPNCYENMYQFETLKRNKKRNRKGIIYQKQKNEYTEFAEVHYMADKLFE